MSYPQMIIWTMSQVNNFQLHAWDFYFFKEEHYVKKYYYLSFLEQQTMCFHDYFMTNVIY